MSSAGKDLALKKEPPLPSGWVVCPSKSYPDRVYYFNVFTGRSSWEKPVLKQYLISDDEQYSKKSKDVITKSSSSISGIPSHKSHERTLASGTDKRPNSSTNKSGILSHKPPELQVTIAKECDSHRKKRDGRVKGKISASNKICVDNEASVEYEYQHNRAAHEKIVLMKRKRKERPSGSVQLDNDYDIEKPPLRRIKSSSKAVNAGLHNTGRKRDIRGLAAKRLKVLQARLAEELVRKENSAGFGKCKASEGSEILQKKLIQERNLSPKQRTIQQCGLPLKNQDVPEACSRDLQSEERSPYGNLIRDNERSSEKIMKQNLSEQNPYVAGEVTSHEHELMEWEPIEDEKILSHIQEVRNQIQQDGSINPDDRGIQTVEYDTNSVFSADGKPEWFIVIDTNVLISSLNYVEELRDTNYKGLGFPVLVIPWQVLQELDMLKVQQGSAKSSSLVTRARRAVSFLHTSFTSKHPRIRGQTGLDAIPKDFKVEVPDDAIIYCCLQVAQRTNRVILLSNDKNLCNKAIVSGIKAYQKAEMQQALEELSSESEDQIRIQCSSGNELSATNMYIPAAVNPVSPAGVASVVDSILCKLKSLLKELLGRVLENEMHKVYDSSWKIIVLVKPPWTLSDIIICLLKHWIAVFSIVLPADVKAILEFLKGFFDSARQNKGYGHSLHEVKTVLQASLHLCMAIQSNEYRDLVSTCTLNIERLRKCCEETFTGLKNDGEEELKCDQNKSQNEDVKTVMDVLKNCWELVQNFCALMCDVLGWEHHVVYNRPEPLPSADILQDRLQYIYPRVDSLIKNITSIWELPISALTADHEAVKNLYLTLTNFFELQEVKEKITPELILKFCTTEDTRSTLEITKTMFEEIIVVLDRGINYSV